MKKLLLFVTFFSLFVSSKAQTYYPFQTDTAQWNVSSYDGSWPNSILRHYFYFINGDTVIDSIQYSKIYYDIAAYDTIIDTIQTFYMGGLREHNKRIYFKPCELYQLFSLKCGIMNTNLDEFLLYRFDLSIGDTFTLNQYFPAEDISTVIDIDSVMLGGNFRKRYKIDNWFYSYGFDYWIEGIGSQYSLFGPSCWVFEGYDLLLCYKDPQLDYIGYFNWDDDCIGWVVGEAENTKPIFRIYPNPAKTNLYIENEEDIGLLEVNIYNLMGQNRINNRKVIDHVDVSLLEQGIYVIEIASNKNKIRQKLIIKR